ncbi:DNA internalization-related competence protein ComEC/Rec2 [Paenibacillus sp. CMAA1364]
MLGLIWLGLSLILLASIPILNIRWRLTIMIWLAFTLSGGYWEWVDVTNVSSLPLAMHQDITQLDMSSIQAEGMITSIVNIDGDRVSMNLELSAIHTLKVSETLLLQVKLQTQEEQLLAMSWQRGDMIKAQGTLEIPSTARNFDAFDYRNYLRTKKIHWIIKVDGLNNVQVTPNSSWGMISILRLNDLLREKIATKMDQLYQGRHAGYMNGLIIGMRDDVDPMTYGQFSQLGLSHILAVSGTHVAVFVACLMLIMLSWFRLTRETTLTIVIVLIPCYVLLTGCSPSVIRAGIMSMITLYALRQGLLKDGLNIISATAFVMLVWNPYLLLNVSFQLSFIVTLGLILYLPLARSMLKWLPSKLGGAIAVAIIAQLISFPLTIYYFNQFSLLSFLANLLLVPLISAVVMPMGMTSLILGSLWFPVGRSIAWVVEWLNKLTFAIVEGMNAYPAWITIWPSPSVLWICSYYILLYVLLRLGQIWVYHVRRDPVCIDDTLPLEGVLHSKLHKENGGHKLTWKQWIVAPFLILFIVLLYTAYQPPSLQGAGQISFIDVGQGDCILITTPDGKQILVDGGGTLNFRKEKDIWKNRREPFEVGEKVVVPLLKKRGIHHLDAVIITHGDQDHFGGLQAVLDHIPVKVIMFNGTLTGGVAFNKLFLTALDKDIPMYALHNKMIMRPDSHTQFTFISPDMTQVEQEGLPVVKEQNHHSVVFTLEMNSVRMLLTGDMDVSSELNILKDKANANLISTGIDIIKIAHHGSSTSTSEQWLSHWKGSVAVISVGIHNTYGHPKAEVVDRIKEHDMTIYRTDQHGEVQMRLHPNGVWIRNKLN